MSDKPEHFRIKWKGRIGEDRYIVADVLDFGYCLFLAKPFKKNYDPLSKNVIEEYEDFIKKADGIVPDEVIEKLKQEVFIEKL